MRYSIGVDLGGTDIKAGLVSSVGDISCRVVLPTDVETGGPKAVAARIAEAVRQVLVQVETTGLQNVSGFQTPPTKENVPGFQTPPTKKMSRGFKPLLQRKPKSVSDSVHLA